MPRMHKGSAEQYRKAIELAPNDAGAYSNWGIALANQGDHKGAAEQYRKAIEIDPTRYGFLRERI